MMLRRRSIAVLACLLGACAEGPPGDTSAGARDSAGVQIVENTAPAAGVAWRLSDEPLVEISGDGLPEETPLDPGSVYGDSRGRIIVGDGLTSGWHAIFAYDSTGAFLFKAGGEGRGPGEFRQLWWAAPYRGDSIAAFDMGEKAVYIYDADGRYARGFRIPQWMRAPAPGTYGMSPYVLGPYPDGSFLAYPGGTLDLPDQPGPAWYSTAFLRVAPSGESWDTLGDLRVLSQQYWTGTNQMQFPFGLQASMAVSNDELIFGSGESFELRYYDDEGNVRKIVRRAYERPRVTEADVQKFKTWYLERMRTSPGYSEAVADRVRRRLEELRFAERKPAFSSVLEDSEGNVWVEEFRWFVSFEVPPDPGPSVWSVFAPDGEWLAQVEVPARFLLQSVTSDQAYGFFVDEVGVKHVRVYELIKH
jgi:hypothetical protein